MAAFFDLPREIRDKIYEICLVMKGEIAPFPGPKDHLSCLAANRVQSQQEFYANQKPEVVLLQLNKQINIEATLILYGQNLWRVSQWDKNSSKRNKPFWSKAGKFVRHVVISLNHNDLPFDITWGTPREALIGFWIDHQLSLLSGSRLETAVVEIGGCSHRVECYRLLEPLLQCPFVHYINRPTRLIIKGPDGNGNAPPPPPAVFNTLLRGLKRENMNLKQYIGCKPYFLLVDDDCDSASVAAVMKMECRCRTW
ncbi:MAG: hypothetical protein Q9178_002731 [Gyalolechia marmorata]